NVMFPSLRADFHLDWSFSTATGLSGSRPNVAFNSIRLDLGKFLSDFLNPIVSQVQKIVAPIKPVLDILTAPLPVLSDLAPTRALLDQDGDQKVSRSEEHTSELQSRFDLVCRLLLEKQRHAC